jgi:predicted DNA-binding protein
MRTTQTPESRKIGVNISLDLATLAKLDEAARQEGLSRSALIRRMVEEWIEPDEEDEEDRLLGAIAKRRLEDPTEGRSSWEDVKRRLRL